MIFKHGFISVCSKANINNSTILTFYRFGHTMRGKRPGVALSLESRLLKENAGVIAKEESYVDIGFPVIPSTRRAFRKEVKPKINPEQTLINLKDILKAGETSAAQQNRLRTIAEHYGIYKDLFKYGYFVPRVPLTIKYSTPEYYCTVYNGNVIKPTEAAQPPEVIFTGNTDLITGNVTTNENYWSLLLLNPDCKTTDTDGEHIHWFIANIPGNNVKNGDVIVPYFQPIPFKGLGYQRYIFVLFKQNSKMDFNAYKTENVKKLQQLNFNTEQFYRKHQDDITPAGLAFYQSNWDESVTDVFQKRLEDSELFVKYDHPKPYVAEQKWFPLKQPFNKYMEKYWSREKANELEIKKHLKESHPFKDIKINLRFPHAQPIDKSVPSWLKAAIKKERLNTGRDESFKRL